MTARLGQRVRKAREALQIKQQDLADEVGCTAQHISRIELGQVAPSVQTLLKLSRRLGVTTDYLLTGRETVPLDATGAIRAVPDMSAVAKRHLIGVLNELRAGEMRPTGSAEHVAGLGVALPAARGNPEVSVVKTYRPS